jgi:hypothetical protein
MLAARAEPKNGPKENKKTGNFKPVVFDEYQTGVDSAGYGDAWQQRNELHRAGRGWRLAERLANFFMIEADSERAVRWLIALMVLCCGPLAIDLTATASALR